MILAPLAMCPCCGRPVAGWTARRFWHCRVILGHHWHRVPHLGRCIGSLSVQPPLTRNNLPG